jgi:Flp pilus assembly protein TadD
MAQDRLATLMGMLEQDPADTFCLYGVAQEHAKADRLDEAVRWFERLLQVEPSHAYGHFHLAKVLERDGRVGEASEVLRRGLAAARASGDAKAANEIAGFLDEITP